MLFSKQKSTPTAERGRHWSDAEAKLQRFRLKIEQVSLSLTGSWGKLEAGLLGCTEAPALRGHGLDVCIEVLDPFETPERLRAVWRNFPQSTEGICRVHESGTPPDGPRLYLTLYCEQRALPALLQQVQFASGANVRSVLDVELDHPDPQEPGFWLEQWRTAELRVRNWRLISEYNQPSASGA